MALILAYCAGGAAVRSIEPILLDSGTYVHVLVRTELSRQGQSAWIAEQACVHYPHTNSRYFIT